MSLYPKQSILSDSVASRSFLFRRSHLTILSAVLCLAPDCRAQDLTPFHSCTLNAGAAWTQLDGAERQNFYSGWDNFQAGGGFAVAAPSATRSWAAFITADFLFDQLDVKPSALQQARTLNPTNIGLLQATGAHSKFYSTTLDLTFRFPVKSRAAFYAFAGFGWLRRDLVFTGVSGEGALLQPGGPTVFGTGGDSGAFDAGVGVNLLLPRQAKGVMLYLEGRVLHGLAVNDETTILPISFGVRW